MSLPRPALVLLLSAAFAAAHTQAPLFYSNQNQYLLHGLAGAGYGHLEHDWLANTKDPTPLFSAGVGLAYRLGGLWPLQAGYFVLLMGYFLAAWWLVSGFVGWDERSGGLGSPTARAVGLPSPTDSLTHPTKPAASSVAHLLAFAVLFTAAHAGILRWLSVQAFGVDYPWYFQAGVAGQYILGPGLQPSAFGVLLVASLAAFANGRPVLAGGLAGAAVAMHTTYGLPAGLLVLGYVAALWRTGRPRTALGVGLLALLVAAPAVGYAAVTFRQTDPTSFDHANFLARFRIPHHAVVGVWFDGVAMAQIAWMTVGLLAVYRTRLFAPLMTMAAGGYALTLAQLALESDRLALLFPWRVSVVLVPVTTAVLAARAARRVPAWLAVGLLAGLVAGGVAVTALGLGYRTNDAERPMLDWVREHAGPGDVYLIPTRGPQGGPKARGVLSATFLPPPRPEGGKNLIPVDLQRFRLATGAPIYVDFKSVPYSNPELAEWHRRWNTVERWYSEPDWDQAGPVHPFAEPAVDGPPRTGGLRDQLRGECITHVVVPRDRPVRGGFLEPVYADSAYTVYRIE